MHKAITILTRLIGRMIRVKRNVTTCRQTFHQIGYLRLIASATTTFPVISQNTLKDGEETNRICRIQIFDGPTQILFIK